MAAQAIGDKWLISEGVKTDRGDKVVVSGLQKRDRGVGVKATTDIPAAKRRNKVTVHGKLLLERPIVLLWVLSYVS